MTTRTKSPSPPAIRRFPSAKQRRMDELLNKNSEGTITVKERQTLEQLVADAEALMIENGKMLSKLAQRDRIPDHK